MLPQTVEKEISLHLLLQEQKDDQLSYHHRDQELHQQKLPIEVFLQHNQKHVLHFLQIRTLFQ